MMLAMMVAGCGHYGEYRPTMEEQAKFDGDLEECKAQHGTGESNVVASTLFGTVGATVGVVGFVVSRGSGVGPGPDIAQIPVNGPLAERKAINQCLIQRGYDPEALERQLHQNLKKN